MYHEHFDGFFCCTKAFIFQIAKQFHCILGLIYCSLYNGIDHPKNRSKCCARSCGIYCGEVKCEDGPGGKTSCCGSQISENKICGVKNTLAPCTKD